MIPNNLPLNYMSQTLVSNYYIIKASVIKILIRTNTKFPNDNPAPPPPLTSASLENVIGFCRTNPDPT